MDIKVLKENGVTSANYRKIFTAEVLPKQVASLIDLIRGRIQEGRRANIADHRHFWAIDLAHDVPFNQITPTLIQSFLAKKWNSADDAYAALSSWGLSEKDLFIESKTPDGKNGKMLNPPVFFQILVPLVKAYCTIRLAKIFNERDTSPLLPFNPAKNTLHNAVLCEVTTDIVNTISSGYGYPAVLCEAIQQMLKYGISLSFPRESWHYDEQDIWDDKENKSKTVTTKEGIRYVFPHPTRMGYDLSHPTTTFNSDTGCEFAWYWDVTRYGDILDNKTYWNRENIFFGTNWFEGGPATNYFSEVFPCRLKFPELATGEVNSRESKSAYYSGKTHRDKAIFTTEYFMRLVPKQWGLGYYSDDNLKTLEKTYNHPVWHRFVIAGDDTVIFCEPIPYCPNWFMGYDYDPQCARTSSLSLELIPHQDMIGNLLSQAILTAKQNLANCTFYDKNVIDGTAISDLEKSGNRRYTGQNFIPVDSMRMARQGVGMDKALFPMKLEKQSVQEILQMINMTLNIMERVLQITAQEAGAAASHQQSKAEIVQTGGASSNRLSFTSSFVDNAIDAWKRQLFEAFSAFGDAGITAQVSSNLAEEEDLKAVLGELGFTVRGKVVGGEKLVIAGKKSSLKPLHLEAFARTNEGPQSLKNSELAQAITTTVGMISANPVLSQAIGPKNILNLMEQVIAIGSGVRGTKLALAQKDGNGEVPENVMAAIQAGIQAAMKAVEEKIAKPLAQANAAEDAKISNIEQILQQLQGIYDTAKANQEKTAIKAQETQQKMQLRAAESQANDQRKDRETKAKIARDNAVAAAELQREQDAHQVELQKTVHETNVNTHLATITAAHGSATAEAAGVKESLSLNYKDAPDEIKSQMEQRAGFEPAQSRKNSSVKEAAPKSKQPPK